MAKVFTPNKNGKFEFTKEELEALLDEVWQDGYSQGRPYWWCTASVTCDGNAIVNTAMDEVKDENT